MVRNALCFSLLILSIFTVYTQVESSKVTSLSKGVSGFSLTEDEIQKFHIWPNGFIPYYIDVTSYSDKVLRDKIRRFLNMVNSITALNFIELPSPPEDDHTRWVFFINRKGLLGCADHSVWNFTSAGVQRVVLGYDCMNKEGELPEAVLAIAGVPAQHTAPNRDEYIEVFTDNVIPDKIQLFEKLSDTDWLFHDLPYDYDSVGHYHNFKHSMDGKTVIQPRNPDITIGETKGFSDIDIWKIGLLYNFITQKELLNVPDCQKLFKTSSKFKNYVPDKNIPKPKQKPGKYTGLQPNKDIEYEDVSADNKKGSSDKESIENNGDQGTEENKEELSAEINKTNVTIIYIPHEDNNGSGKKSAKNITKETEKRKPNQDLLSELSDHHSGTIEELKLALKDPLEFLSDYSSDKDDMQKEKIVKEQQQTLNYAVNQIRKKPK